METGISIRRCTEPDLRGSIGSVRCLTGRLEIFAFPDAARLRIRSNLGPATLSLRQPHVQTNVLTDSPLRVESGVERDGKESLRPAFGQDREASDSQSITDVTPDEGDDAAVCGSEDFRPISYALLAEEGESEYEVRETLRYFVMQARGFLSPFVYREDGVRVASVIKMRVDPSSHNFNALGLLESRCSLDRPFEYC